MRWVRRVERKLKELEISTLEKNILMGHHMGLPGTFRRTAKSWSSMEADSMRTTEDIFSKGEAMTQRRVQEFICVHLLFPSSTAKLETMNLLTNESNRSWFPHRLW